MKYIIYLRVSTDQQKESGLGLEAQRQMCYRFINDPLANVIEYSDEGFSGALKMEKRPGLLAAINALEKDDILLIAKRDRIGRDIIGNAMIERAVERKKARLISASGDVKDDNDPSSILMKRMIDAFAEYERLIIGVRTKAALQVKKGRNQRVGYVPYGFKLREDKIHLDRDEKEQEVLKQIMELREECASYRKIAKELNEKQILNRDNMHWNHVSIFRVSHKLRHKR
jgi:DNA invertase Pin-like site-specific DNA recombinase